jgi:hypothetical protein
MFIDANTTYSYLPQLKDRTSDRKIVTLFYADMRRRKIVRTIASRWANNAVKNCVGHMQLNTHGAALAEVYDGGTGELHAIVKFHMGVGKIEILYQRAVHKDM